jgi:hypothetical protein
MNQYETVYNSETDLFEVRLNGNETIGAYQLAVDAERLTEYYNKVEKLVRGGFSEKKEGKSL